MNNTDIKTIKTAIKRLKPFTDAKPHLPIMGCIRLESRDGKLSLTVPTLKYGVAASIDKCKADVQFNRSGDHGLELKSGSLTFKLKGKDASDFPVLPDPPGDFVATSSISYGDIRSELEFVSRATCDQTPQNFTAGVLFDYTDANRLRLIGTDGRRLHSTHTVSQCHDTGDEKPAYLVPVKYVDAFNRLKVASDTETYFKFYGDNRLDWTIPTAGLSGTVSLLDSPYPEYRKVIPDDCTSRFRLNVQDTIETLNGLSAIACTQDGRDMIVVKANGTLNLTARAESMGEASGTVPCSHLEGQECVFALNVHYFTETLKIADKHAVIMANSGSLEPVRFDYLETDRIAVVMPVRLPE